MFPGHPGARGTRHRPLGLVVGALALAGTANCAVPFQTELNVEETERFNEPFAAGELLDLRNINGHVAVASWDREEAEIVARKVGPSSTALEDVRVEVNRSSRGLQVRTRFPKKGRMWGQRYGSVHYSIRLPQSADLRISTVHGPVEVAGISGKVEAQTVNGSLRLTGHRGSVNAKTVNGPIECELDSFGQGENHSLRTVNGRVQLTLGPEASGQVDARAINGRVIMELADPEHLDTPTRRRKKVQIGDGGGECRVRTVNGTIHVTDGS